MAIVETTIKVSNIGHIRCQVTNLLSRQTMTAEVVMARMPDRVVASPYVGMKYGSIVMMKMPKPKPVVRCTKLAPMLSRNMAITMLLTSDLPLRYKQTYRYVTVSSIGLRLLWFASGFVPSAA